MWKRWGAFCVVSLPLTFKVDSSGNTFASGKGQCGYYSGLVWAEWRQASNASLLTLSANSTQIGEHIALMRTNVTFLGGYIHSSGTVFWESAIERGYSSVETSSSLTRRWVVSAGKHRSAKHRPLLTPIVKGHPHRAENLFASHGIATRLCAVETSTVCPRSGGYSEERGCTRRATD
jgi:hypothetical protein